MDGDDWFFAAAAATTVVGIIILVLVSAYFRPPLTSIEGVKQDMLEQNVRVIGRICDLHRFSGGSMVVTLCTSNSELKVYLPYHLSQKIGGTLKENQLVEVIGTVEVYQGELEVVPTSAQDVSIK
ncbi:MAG: hypothetical protein GF334_00570 [Candidatus Altiarchaeales archaeon]|nr:hypothetical protein [Candidatus Altiarchaeales archaeon]